MAQFALFIRYISLQMTPTDLYTSKRYPVNDCRGAPLSEKEREEFWQGVEEANTKRAAMASEGVY